MDALWQAIADVIRAVFIKPENIALLISVSANVALCWFIIRSKAEDRIDRQAMTGALTVMAGMLDKLRIVIAAELGKSDI